MENGGVENGGVEDGGVENGGVEDGGVEDADGGVEGGRERRGTKYPNPTAGPPEIVPGK